MILCKRSKTESIVCRVEDEFGFGPYRASHDGKGITGINTPKNPTCWSDPGIMHTRDEVAQKLNISEEEIKFGFLDENQCHSWFDGEDKKKEKLFKDGYLLSYYWVPNDHLIIGKKQIVFSSKKAEKRSHIFLETFFKGEYIWLGNKP